MKILKLIAVVLIVMVATTQTTLAQKIGHMNSDQLLLEMPAIKSANSQLEAYSKQKEKEITAKLEVVNKFYTETMTMVQQGKLSPVQQQQKEAELQKKQTELQKAQQTAQQDVLAKEAELYQPIYDKVNKAIEAVAKENGYDYILNTKSGAFLHINESDDVTSLVKSKLGL